MLSRIDCVSHCISNASLSDVELVWIDSAGSTHVENHTESISIVRLKSFLPLPNPSSVPQPLPSHSWTHVGSTTGRIAVVFPGDFDPSEDRVASTDGDEAEHWTGASHRSLSAFY